MSKSNIVFDRLYMDLSQEERDKMSPMQLEDYTAKLQDRKKEVLSELEKEITDSNRIIKDVSDNLKAYWRDKAQESLKGPSDESYGPRRGRHNLSSLIQQRAQVAEYIVSLEAQHDWLTGTEMKQ